MPSVSELIPSPLALLGQLTAFGGLRAPGWGVGDRNFLGKLIRLKVIAFDGFYRTLRQLDADWPPSSQASTPTLRRQANIFGLDDGAGGYGFKVPQAARGGQGILTGTGGTVVDPALVPAPGTLTGPDGATRYVLRQTVTLSGGAPGTGQATGIFDAVTPGAIGNLSPGAILRWDATPPGVDSTVTLVAGFGGTGKDEEAPGDAQRRLARRLDTPPKGGAPQDYSHGAEAWAENARDEAGNLITGIRSYGYNGGAGGQGTGYDGGGAAVCVITMVGSGTSRIPTVQALQRIERFIRGATNVQGKRPMSHSFRAIAPFMDPSVTGLILQTRVAPSKPLYAFDWARNPNGTDFQVDAGGWDNVSKLRLLQTAPADLKLAIQNGQRPRIFVDTRIAGVPVGPVIPPMARCVGFTDAAGKTTLELELPLPVGWQPPSGGDRVYSGGAAICDPATGIPAALLAYVDSLGPSRVSGLYDSNDYWSDICAISGLEAAAKNVLASDQITPLIERTLAGTTQIAVGSSGVLAVQDVQAPDNNPFGPALWHALRILVLD